MSKTATLTVQQWGNSLAVRIQRRSRGPLGLESANRSKCQLRTLTYWLDRS